MDKLNPTTTTIKSYLGAIVSIVFVIVLVLSFAPIVTTEDDSSNVNQESDTPTLSKKSPPKKLQIGVRKRVENCDTKAKKGDLLHIHYKGTLFDTGDEFDSSYPRNEPLKFTLGSGQVIKGWDLGLLGMCVGEKRKLVIPPDLGYGSRGAGPKIPADATLVFEVECMKIESRNRDEF
ncbi:peptidyl-prolyl cis-trans isomerase FKBP2-like isoform X2 [Brevipalpus obovatus]|uniref:peptidyl-prolyl cis-trans isomerase FKBP2-like isoform X2 n=1 Tax=Brevipalpus obovatus TaxID=246614 RepID=UPI003D9DF904